MCEQDLKRLNENEQNVQPSFIFNKTGIFLPVQDEILRYRDFLKYHPVLKNGMGIGNK